jgi:glutamine synthetase
MPGSLGQAITAFKESSLMKEIFGDYIYNNLIRIKEGEWAEFRQYVTDWEIDKYLDIY